MITLIVIYDIAMRFLIGRPSDWAFDVTKMLFGAHFMLMAAYGLRHHAHVEVDVLKRLLSRRKQAGLEILGYLLFFVPFIGMLLSLAGISSCAPSAAAKPPTAWCPSPSIR